MKPLQRYRLSSLLVLWLVMPAQAEIYKWQDQDGNTHFGDRPPASAKPQKVEVKINSYKSVSVQYSPDWFYKREKRKGDSGKVIMYSAEWCGVCKRAKRYFAKHNIPYTELDIDKSEQAKQGFRKLKGSGVPIILVGNKRMNGFSAENFQKIYTSAR